MSRPRTLATAALVVAASAAFGQNAARAASLVPFDQFYQQVTSSSLAAQMSESDNQVSSPTAFAEMRSHVASLYSGVTVKHSFLLDSHPYDCVPIMQQPTVKALKLKSIATPPPQIPMAAGARAAAPPPVMSQVDPAQATDALGNSLSCEDGTIPMRRVTLQDVGRFKTLAEFFQKGPAGAGRYSPPDIVRPAVSLHKYAHSYQFAANLGGTTDINIWSPFVNTKVGGEIFSLAQFWYINRTGPVQTVEGGIQNYPDKYGTNSSVLFIYFTADDYNKTGCYNLDCTAFVQTNKNIYLGRGFNATSADGGPQYVVNLRAFLYQGNWWLYLGGGAAANAFGYYPGSLFKGTAMAQGANEIDYGGEVVGSTIWPPMGSGRFASTGFGHSSFQKNIAYYPDTLHYAGAGLTASQTSPSCYTDATTNFSGGSWGTFFFFGGPGGSGC